ncbi:hypothetical protein [Microvirga lotononidis]|uniref:Uncharacterized protein n=1 Tax=Microvirga lotononidis TaxID=864069 RepID=I4YPW9_9HYPH|nr:hypothetical protein [Microvirga lotononidis]EIM26011.1 hypothetical protein MicloDRAFT_00067410 [Microvirga lotononidis]WQO25920.1 hypothetical protein U0023_14515 [Microvirga lotononidis]
MDQPYSLWADWLSKFHTWPEFIQALWLVAGPVTLLGLAWLVMRGLRDLVRPSPSERHGRSEWRGHGGSLGHGEWRGPLIYGVYQDPQGRWMVYRHGREPEAVDWENLPPELIGRGSVVQGAFRRPEA